MDFSEAKSFLYQLFPTPINKGDAVKKYPDYKLDNILAFTELLGNPHMDYPKIHVGGTNGKGSVCAMLESIYRNAGYKTGMYTSPHLVYLGERICINGQPISQDEIINYVEVFKPIIESLEVSKKPSFFEVMTAMAFLHFKKIGVDVAIIEVGLGGRLDATNIITPEVSVVTSIGLDHTEILGDTVELIAKEKAGIIKPGVPVAIGLFPKKAYNVFVDIANDKKSSLVKVGNDFMSYPKTNLHGSVQRRNAELARIVVNKLSSKIPISAESIFKGLNSVKWAARWQKVKLNDGRNLIIDVTHNSEGLEFLEENLLQLDEKPIIVAGASNSVRANAIIPVLCKYAKELILVELSEMKEVSFEMLHQCVPNEAKSIARSGDLREIFSTKGSNIGSSSGTVLVTGSIYLAGEVLALISN